MGNARLGSSSAFLEHQTRWVISEKHEMNRQVSANTSAALPHGSGDVCLPDVLAWPLWAMGKNLSPQAGRAITAMLDLIPCLCAGKAIWRFGRERGIQNSLFQVRSAAVFALGAGLGFAMGTGRSSGFRSEAQPCWWLTEIRAPLRICMKLVTIRCSSASRSAAENTSHQEAIWGNLGEKATNGFACNTVHS